MNRHVYLMAVLSLFLANPPSSFAHDCKCPAEKSPVLKEKAHKSKKGKKRRDFDNLSVAEIKQGMGIVKKAITASMPKNNFFKNTQELHEFIDEAIEEAHEDTRATTGLSQIITNFFEVPKINATNFPDHLVTDIKNTIKDIYRENHGKIYHSMDKGNDKFSNEGLKNAWEGLATGDTLIAGHLLVALKGLQFSKTKTTFKQDFESQFHDFTTLYAISTNLENFLTMATHRLEGLKHSPQIEKKYKYGEIFENLHKGNLKTVLEQVSDNIVHGDQFVSLYLLAALVGLNVEGSFQELDNLRNNLHTQSPQASREIKDFLDNYYFIYGHGHHTQLTPKDIAKKIEAKPKTPVKEPPSTVARSKPNAKPEVKVEKKAESAKKSPPELPGYTIKPYKDGKLWYFRGHHPVKPTPE